MLKGIGADQDRFLLDLRRIEERSRKATAEISSGIRISNPSDDPGELPRLFHLQAELTRFTAIEKNLGSAKAEVDSAEASLRHGVRLLEQAVVAGSRGAGMTVSPAVRQQLAAEVQSILQDIVGISNAQVNGRYLFSGDQDQSPQYSFDTGMPGSVVQNHTAPETRSIEDADGSRFLISKTAAEIFDRRDADNNPADGNVFHALDGLVQALTSGTPDQIASATEAARKAGEHLNDGLAFYGRLQVRISEANARARQKKLQTTTDLAAVREADLPAAILALTETRTAMEAALSAQSRLPKFSLFDYLA